MEPELYHRTGDRRGVALILVIGMLALMMVLGVTFSIFMRSERNAAGNFRDGVQKRELLQVALARAIDAIETSIGSAVYPSWDILQSGGSADVNSSALAGSVSNWIPWSVLAATNVSPKWCACPAGTSGIRYSYLVLNCSGLLDANYAGGGTRGSGTNVVELQTASLPEIGTAANAAALAGNRPFETLQELGVKAGSALSGLPMDLVVYSNFPTNYSGGADLGLVDLSGNVAALQGRKASIITALNNSGIPAADQSFIFNNLLYYVDTTSDPMKPDDLGTPLTKSVPMINEVRVTNSVIMAGAGKCTTLVQVDVEWFYPFVKASADNFNIVCDVEIIGVTPTKGIYVPPFIVSQSKPGYTAGLVGPCYDRAQFSISMPPVTFTTNDTVQLAFKIGAKVMRGVTLVDATPYPYASAGYFSVTGTVMTLPTILSGGEKGFECIDPRFNWNASSVGGQWVPYTPLNASGTIKSKNWITGQLFPNKYLGMYVAGGPLQNVGELAYLLRGAKSSDKWNSIKVFTNSSPDRVLDYFVVNTSTNRRGFVNINTRSAEVLVSVFSGLNLEAFPGQSSTVAVPTVTPAQATNLAAVLMNQTQSPVSRMSDYGTNVMLQSIVNPTGTLTPFQAESVLRESAGLLHFRQNYFIVLLYANKLKSLNNKAEWTAVAEIWRDPLANAQGIHPCFVRSFKILNN